MLNRTQWLEADRDTLFVLTPEGRIVHENDPGQSQGPRFWLAGCSDGNVSSLADRLPDEITTGIERLLADEKPLTDPQTPPRYFERYLSLLKSHAPITGYNYGRIYDLPHGLAFASEARLVGSDSVEGQALAQQLAETGMPDGLVEVGFHSLADFWAPWCVAIVDGEIAAIAFAARLGERGAELGLTSVKRFRGQGFAAAATAGWSKLPSLRHRRLFYSHAAANLSSQQVTKRLNLTCGGVSLRIY